MEYGPIPLVSSGETNNGIVGFIDSYGDGKAEIFTKNKITIDMFGNPFYQPFDFYSVSHGRVNILQPLFELSASIGLFLATIIKQEQYKYSYGRAVYSTVAENIDLLLPIQHDENGYPIVDNDKKFSDEGFIPDWIYMENYIKSLCYGNSI